MTAPLPRPGAGIAFICIGMVAISLNDVLIKFLSGGYPLHQMVFTRSIIGITFSMVLVQAEGGWRILKTPHPWLHALRGALIVVSNLTFFTALAVLPLAEATAVFFVAPLMITLLSIPLLGERVGVWRFAAVLVGLVGVVVMTRPWQGADEREVSLIIYTMPVAAALAYALNNVLTRKLGSTSKASAMAVYIQASFILVSLVFWAVAGDGRWAEGLTNESLIFLLRAWVWPEGVEIGYFAALGFGSAVIGYSLGQAYRLADAATIAPFEYVGLPLAIFWGWMVFGEVPDSVASIGIALILGGGIVVVVRERLRGRRMSIRRGLRRH